MGKTDADRDAADQPGGRGRASIRDGVSPDSPSLPQELEPFGPLLDLAGDFLFLVDNRRRLIIRANESALSALGFTQDALLGQPFDHLVAPPRRDELSELFRRVETAPDRVETETVLRGVGGRDIPVALRLVRVGLLAGDARNFTAVAARDLSGRVAPEDEPRATRGLPDALWDFSPSILIRLDGRGRIVQLNPAAERGFGLKAGAVIGARLEDVLPTLAPLADGVAQAIREKKTVRAGGISLDGREGRGGAEAAIHPVSGEGDDGVVVQVDVAAGWEECMLLSERMLSMAGLAAGMAHEINNPLAVILGNAQIIVSRLTTDQKRNLETARECGLSLNAMRRYLEERSIMAMLTAISDAGRRAGRILESMLGFSRRESVGAAPVDLADLLDRTAALAAIDYDLKKNFDFKSIRIIREYQPEAPLVVCDAVNIQLAFLGVLRRGAWAMAARRGSDAEPLFIFRVKTDDASSGMVRVEIEDNGAGEDKSAGVGFSGPFFSDGDAAARAKFGIEAAARIVTQGHGGAFRVASRPGGGTVVVVELPVKGFGTTAG